MKNDSETVLTVYSPDGTYLMDVKQGECVTVEDTTRSKTISCAFIDTAYSPPVPTTAPALPKGVLRKGKQQIGLFVPECMR